MSEGTKFIVGFVIGMLGTVALVEIYDRIWGFRSR